MRIGMMTAVLGIAAGVGLGGGELAGENAALAYYQAWSELGANASMAMDRVDGGYKLSEDWLEHLDGSEDAILDLLDASMMGAADWDVDLRDGPHAKMPHLGKMRGGALSVGADALRCVEVGDHTGATERVAALYRMSTQLNHDEFLISALVGKSIANLGTNLTMQLIDDGVIGNAEARIILESARGVDRDDPFGIRDSIIGEWRMITEYVLRKAPADGAGKWLLNETSAAVDSEPGRLVLAMERNELLREMGGYSAYFGDVLTAWDNEDAQALAEAEERLQMGEYGALAELLGATMTRVFDSWVRFELETDELIERLEEIAD